MYWAKIPIQSIVIEKLRIVTPITLPNPGKGTPRMIQKIARAKMPNTDVRLRIIPITETHARGFALYASMLLKELPTTEKKDMPIHLDSPANLGGLGISIDVVLNPTHAPSPRRNR